MKIYKNGVFNEAKLLRHRLSNVDMLYLLKSIRENGNTTTLLLKDQSNSICQLDQTQVGE